MIAGGDYYTKLEGVSTSSGQIDIFTSTGNTLTIDFDDTKTGTYNMLFDNFHDYGPNNTGTGTVYMNQVHVIPQPNQYIINWNSVPTNQSDAVQYNIDTDNNGTYETTTSIPPVFQDLTPPTTTHILTGEPTPNTPNSYIETVTIELNSTDNDGGVGIQDIYYALGTATGTGELIYLPYTEPVMVNGVGEYTLNYYSTDKFNNIEQTKTTTFTLTERPETYSGNISGYVYDDENQNGQQDEQEKLMAGWKICIDQNNNNDCEEQTEPFTISNNDGYYEFNSLQTGTYKILEIPHQNWTITTPTTNYYSINLSNGQQVMDKNFGNHNTKKKK